MIRKMNYAEIKLVASALLVGRSRLACRAIATIARREAIAKGVVNGAISGAVIGMTGDGVTFARLTKMIVYLMLLRLPASLDESRGEQ